MISERRLADVLSDFARTLNTDFPIQGILDHLVRAIVEVLPIDAAGVSLLAPLTSPQVISGSDESAARYEQLQTALGEGPCVAAFDSGAAISVADLAIDERFPRFAASARAEGLAAVFTFPLRSGERTLGALDLYRRTPGSLDERDLEAAQTLADVTTAYLLNAQSRLATVDLVAGVSHELRTPMVSMVGFIELLSGDEEHTLTPDQRFFVESILHAVDRLTGLAEDLLTLATVTDPAVSDQHGPVDLGCVVAQARTTLGPLIAARQLDVVFDVPDEPVVVQGSEVALESMVLNLMTNALKFTPDGGWVRCRVSRVGDAVHLEVCDNGLGIPAAEQALLFSRFFRSSTAKEHAISGTGLGLTIVESIVKAHGGTISVVSTHLAGSTFTVSLPALEPPAKVIDAGGG